MMHVKSGECYFTCTHAAPLPRSTHRAGTTTRDGVGRCSFSGLTHSLPRPAFAADRFALSASSCMTGSVKVNVTSAGVVEYHVVFRALLQPLANVRCLPIVTSPRLMPYFMPCSAVRVTLSAYYHAYRPKGCGKQAIISPLPVLFGFWSLRRFLFGGLFLLAGPSQSRMFISSSLLRHPNSERLSPPSPPRPQQVQTPSVLRIRRPSYI
jgi:hypothetical protein